MSQTIVHPAGWYADPTGRHQHRYWDGAAWTDHVADDGVRSIDALESHAPEDFGVEEVAAEEPWPEEVEAQHVAAREVRAEEAAADAPPAAWYPDPLARFDHRYWDGSAWTEHVATAGTAGRDPLDGAALSEQRADSAATTVVEAYEEGPRAAGEFTQAAVTSNSGVTEGVAVPGSAFAPTHDTVADEATAHAALPGRPQTVAGLVIAGGATVAAAGSFMTWHKVTAPAVGTVSRVGTDGDGATTVLIAILLLAIATLMVRGRIGIVATIAASVLSLGALGIVVANVADIRGRTSDVFPDAADVTARVGTGLAVCAVGMFAALVGSVLAARNRQPAEA